MDRLYTLRFALGISSLVLAGTVSSVGAQGQNSTTLNMSSQSSSGITGTATLAETANGKLRVEIQANGAGAGPQPAHIHSGSCGTLNPTPDVSLTSVTNGSSVTEVDGSLQSLTSSPHAIHMHKSPDELPVYVACADIVMTAAGQTSNLPRAGDASVPVVMLTALSGLGLTLAAGGYALRRRARR
jgi:Cu/Zn superoxide dismutase